MQEGHDHIAMFKTIPVTVIRTLNYTCSQIYTG